MSVMGEKIKIICHQKRWTQAELAKQLHVAPTTVQKWIVGKNIPSIDTIKQIAELFNVSVEQLVDDNYDFPKYRYLEFARPEDLGLNDDRKCCCRQPGP